MFVQCAARPSCLSSSLAASVEVFSPFECASSSTFSRLPCLSQSDSPATLPVQCRDFVSLRRASAVHTIELGTGYEPVDYSRRCLVLPAADAWEVDPSAIGLLGAAQTAVVSFPSDKQAVVASARQLLVQALAVQEPDSCSATDPIVPTDLERPHLVHSDNLVPSLEHQGRTASRMH